jgi:FMN-dependent NADH-azoreductase
MIRARSTWRGSLCRKGTGDRHAETAGTPVTEIGDRHRYQISGWRESMSKLLYLQASPRIERSHSIAVADAFVSAYRKAHSTDQIVSKNLFQTDLPTLDGLALQAKYNILHDLKHTNEELAAWRAVEEVIDEFTSADKYVMAIPMWNFNIPYRLKHYFDLIVQPTYTFSYPPEEVYQGLVTAKPVFIAYARGVEYASGSPREAFDLQTRYVETILGFIGFTDIRKVIVEPTLADQGLVKQRREAAITKAEGMAKAF